MLAEGEEKMEKINTVVVGYGGMGKYHADNIAKFENCDILF